METVYQGECWICHCKVEVSGDKVLWHNGYYDDTEYYTRCPNVECSNLKVIVYPINRF